MQTVTCGLDLMQVLVPAGAGQVLGLCMSNELPGDVDAGGLGTALEYADSQIASGCMLESPEARGL